jgi:hypothetical protein
MKLADRYFNKATIGLWRRSYAHACWSLDPHHRRGNSFGSETCGRWSGMHPPRLENVWTGIHFLKQPKKVLIRIFGSIGQDLHLLSTQLGCRDPSQMHLIALGKNLHSISCIHSFPIHIPAARQITGSTWYQLSCVCTTWNDKKRVIQQFILMNCQSSWTKCILKRARVNIIPASPPFAAADAMTDSTSGGREACGWLHECNDSQKATPCFSAVLGLLTLAARAALAISLEANPSGSVNCLKPSHWVFELSLWHLKASRNC